jgi:DNA-directed RNA polymerase subunit M/transcription elongation factor TFIIS
MESRKCPNCGASLELTRSKTMLECPYCGSKFEVEAELREKIEEKSNSLDEEIFVIERDLSGSFDKEHAGKCLMTLLYCMNELGTAEKVSAYIRKSMIKGSDLAAEGINDSLINAVRGRINSELEPGEQIIVYKDQGIFSKGKEFTVLTNRRFLFFTKKKCTPAAFTDIATLRFDDSSDCPAWQINGDYEKRIPSMEYTGQLTGAAVAFACLSAFEQEPDHVRIRLI